MSMSDRRPVIGIVAALETANYGVWEKPCALLQLSYIEAVQRAGGMALIIPPDPQLVNEPDEILDRLDGLILAGGGDVDPASYNAVPHSETNGTVRERDAIELALVNRAIERDLPVLGICRGMQVLNVARGGTLLQHLPDALGHGEHRRIKGSFDGNEHDVVLEPGSLAAHAVGDERTITKSHHHQGIDELGEGLVITGRATLDDLPESIELPDSSYVLGVQWHPEADEGSRVVESLVEKARVSASRPLV
jgi:putative glutamine amidotransferase